MKKIKILIIITIIITLILICTLVVININTNKIEQNNVINNKYLDNTIKNNIENNNIIYDTNSINNGVSIVPKLEKVISRENFYTVKSCVEKYINYNVDNNSVALYNLLDEVYINQKSINKNNIFDIVEKINKNQIFLPNKMMSAKIANKEIYIVYGNIREDKLNERTTETEFNITIILNKTNNTFSAIPGILKVETLFDKVGNNKLNNNNSYSIINIDDKTMANTYFVNYKSEILYNIQNSYNLLDKEYKEKRFSSFSDYSQYIENNIEKIKKANLTKYSVNKYDDYNLYTCIDQYNNYYIFIETAIMEYTVMLDDYTIDTEEYINNYNLASVKEKNELNIKRCIRMINNKDYKSAYDCLSNGFKENYFKTVNEFKNYIDNTFYNYNSVIFDTFSTEGDIGIYKINISGVQDDRDVTITKTIIMKLGTGTNFEMSFDV